MGHGSDYGGMEPPGVTGVEVRVQGGGEGCEY